jgi:hypothetical protein
MGILKLAFAATAAVSLAACDTINTDAERGLAGAATGAVLSDAFGGNAFTGALVGGTAGYFCDELNVPGCRPRN